MAEAVDLRGLIAASFGEDAAEVWSRFTVGEDDKARLGEAGRRALLLFSNPMHGACCLMSAVYSVMLEAMDTKRCYVTAGSLYVDDTQIYGAEGEFDGKKLFAQSNLDWDGHAWVVYGDWLGDVSLLRTARSGRSHPKLKAHLEEKFGSPTGLFAGKIATLAEDGLRYEPCYVLTLDQVNALARGADLFIHRD